LYILLPFKYLKTKFNLDSFAFSYVKLTNRQVDKNVVKRFENIFLTKIF